MRFICFLEGIKTKNEIDKENVIENFQKSKIVYMMTYGVNGEVHSRPMTNFNDNPYSTMWFPTYNDTQKVSDLEKDPKTLIIFPGVNEDEFFEIEGHSSFADGATVDEKWVWWYLYLHPEMKDMFWFSSIGDHSKRCIIDVHPVSVTKLSKKDIRYIHETYKSIALNGPNA